MWADFKKFILRGNVIDLAIAVLIGTSFNAVIQSLTKYMITPLVTAITGNKADFSTYSFKVNHVVFGYGQVVNSIVSFIIIALVVFFLIVAPTTKLIEYSKKYRQIEPTEKVCPECLSSVPIKATRCAFCTIKFKSSADADA